MKFFTQYDPPTVKDCPLEEHPDEGLVERAGYMETEELVNQLLQAGANLQAFREAEYADESDIPEDAPGFRMMAPLDAVLESRKVRARIRQDNAKAEEFFAEEEKKKAEAEKGKEVEKNGG